MGEENGPIYAGPSPSSKKPKVWPRVELYKDASGLAPGEIMEGTSNDLDVLRVLRGSHSAVIFHGAKGLDIRPNNNDNAVPNDTKVWIDQGTGADPRTICFYARREPQMDSSDKHSSLFDVYDGGNPTHTVFQAVVENYAKNYVYIRLYGSVLALNDDDKKLIDHPYQMGKSTGSGSHDWSHSRLIKEETAEEMINEVLKVADQQPGGILDHLIINAHGTMYPNGAGQIVCGGMVGGNFDSSNLFVWDKLKGKLRYFWGMNCDAGNDNNLFSSIAKRISDPAKGFRGWSTGMYMKTKVKPSSVPPNHIEYFVSPVPKHWDGFTADTKPISRDLFFWNARHSPKLALDGSALYFNIVSRGIPLPTKG
jgi:hypothetical protein